MSTYTPDGQPSAPIVPAAPAAADEPRSLRLEDWLIVLTMAALALITFVNVVLRYFTDASFAWTEEISVFLMIVLAMVAGTAAVARNRHIRIEYFADSGSESRQRALAKFGAAMVALLFGLIAELSARVLWDDVQYGETSPGIGVPQWWYTMWLPILSATYFTNGQPRGYVSLSQPVNSVRLYPPPEDIGKLAIFNLQLPTQDDLDADPLPIPPSLDWVLKYSMLQDQFEFDGQCRDPHRAEYCARRYEDSLVLGRNFPSVYNCWLNARPIVVGGVKDVAARRPRWHNTPG